MIILQTRSKTTGQYLKWRVLYISSGEFYISQVESAVSQVESAISQVESAVSQVESAVSHVESAISQVESSRSEEESSVKENQGQVRKKLKLSLDKKGKKEDKSNRWHFVSTEEQNSQSVKFVPTNTATSTKWALTNFTEWSINRSNCHTSGYLAGTCNPIVAKTGK